VVALISRTANTLQAPLLAKTIESNIKLGHSINLITDFRIILISTTVASIAGALFIPTFQRIYSKAVMSFDIYRSVPKLILYGFSKLGVKQFRNNIKVPSRATVKQMINIKDIPIRIITFNIVVVALLTVGSLASLYAGVLEPEFRTTASTLSSVITGMATVLLFVFIDPYLSIMTDDVIEGKQSEGFFRRCVSLMVATSILGTILAQIIFLPSARLIAYISASIL